jgi:hypothetical protein
MTTKPAHAALWPEFAFRIECAKTIGIRPHAPGFAMINATLPRPFLEPDPEHDTLEAAPESQRWDPLPGSSGHQTPSNPSEDEDEEGRSTDQQLVEDGVARADEDERQEAINSNP